MIDTILTVPPKMADYLNSSEGKSLSQRLAWLKESKVFVTSDPAGQKLGSGGGTVHALWQAWQASGEADLETWLKSTRKLILHAGGQSRRLPAYAAVGKSFLPLPPLDSLPAQRFDQMLCDFQVPPYAETLEEAKAVAMVTSGDVWLDFCPLDIPKIEADIAGVGMRVSPEMGTHFGVFFVKRQMRSPERPVAFFLQKPTAEEIRSHLREYDFFVDTGMWLLSARAIQFLFKSCGWTEAQTFGPAASSLPQYLDLYTDVGAQLNELPDGLTSSVIPLESASFYHLGSSRQLFESVYEIEKGSGGSRKTFLNATAASVCLNESQRPLWADGVSSSISVKGANVVTGLPVGAGKLSIPEYICVDAAPVGESRYCFRPYHLDDRGRGTPAESGMICGLDAKEWFTLRGLEVPDQDVFEIPLYPLLEENELNQAWLDWFTSSKPDNTLSEQFKTKEKLAATEVADRLNLSRYFAQRREGHHAVIENLLLGNDTTQIGFDQDFNAIIDFLEEHASDLVTLIDQNKDAIASRLHSLEQRARFSVFLEKLGLSSDAPSAFDILRDGILKNRRILKDITGLSLQADQIVWARSPVRMDLGGGWTDTPPYCMERGGSVLNVAVTLNGQPPVQVFVRPTQAKQITIKSIDLGSTEILTSFDQIGSFRDPNASFSLVKAALALAGFHPDFCSSQKHPTLIDQLEAIGTGIELTLLCAVPKGSGLGTSSILSATLLGALNRTFDLGWDDIELYRQVIALEQLLTTGGGWQDQAGALFPGLKLIETSRGREQVPTVRYLPSHMAFNQMANRTMLLYYTGITRLAKNILAEIVSDMFLGKQRTQILLDLIRQNAQGAYEAFQLNDHSRIAETLGRSWRYNKMLDEGTTTPEIEGILKTCGGDLSGSKLLGAGGGGYLLLCAKNETAANRIRKALEENPPNEGARFVEFKVADSALEVTVS